MFRGSAGLIRRRLAADQTGFSLIELLVATAIFGIFLTIVVSSVVSLSRASTRIRVTAVSASQELAVFQRLDHQVRYADAINAPGVGFNGDTYIEFRTPGSSTVSGLTTCTQWRFDPTNGRIQSRQWQDTVGPPAVAWAPSAWETLLSNVANDGGPTYPFSFVPATGTGMQQLVLKIDSGNAVISGAAISTTFLARNSSINSPSNIGVAVCPASGSRSS
jgi:prepilin-type N-terminal cleavage/methylation domain-containing protein